MILSFIAILMPLGLGSGAEPTEPTRIGAPIVYQDLMLVLATDKAVAAVIFGDEVNNDTDKGVDYKLRVLDLTTGKESAGSGRLVRSYRREKTDNPQIVNLIDLGSVTSIKAKDVELRWGYQAPGRGWIYYYPEQMTVQIAHREYFEDVNLRIFKKR